MNLLKSPGVQITEKDLSLRINVPTGITITVPGFASQGPIGEPILITSSSELESIFGIPTNSAERYFHHSCREILNTSAQLLAIRLPYGKDAGTAYDITMYSGLFYPMTSAWNAELEVDEWVIGRPQFRPLNKEDYDSLMNGDFTWTSTSTSPSYKYITLDLDGKPVKNSDGKIIYTTSVPASALSDYIAVVDSPGSAFGMPSTGTETTKEVSAGFFILNDLQTVINEVSEGFYVGLADNSSVFVESPNYDSIKEITTIRSNVEGANYFTLPTTRLEFALSATMDESLGGVTSVSENLEKVGFAGFGTTLYQDHLSLGVFRVRRSSVDPTKLTLGAAERYLGSLDAARKQTNPSGGNPVNAFIEDIVTEGSPSIKMAINPSIARNFDWTLGGTTPTCRVTVHEDAKKLFPIGIYSADTRNVEKAKAIGNVPLKLDKALRMIENPETIELDVIIDAGLSTIFAATYDTANKGDIAFDDSAYITPNAIFDESWKCVVLPLVNFAENTRKDCMAIIDLPRPYFIRGSNQKILDVANADFTTNVSKPLKNLVAYAESNYVATYGNWIKMNDQYNSKRYWHPSSAYAAAVFARNDAVSQPWFAPAGLNRGLFNALDIAINPNQKQRDVLYEMSINPIVFFNGDGHTIMGQKTLQFKPTAFDRINVRRLFLALERQVQKTLKYFVFEPNTQILRSRLVNTIKPLFEFAKSQQGVYDYLIVCDERNNTPDSIDRNELIVDIYLKPVRAAEFILVNFIATRTGQDFAELI